MNRKTQTAILYMLAGAFLIALPTYSKHYRGNTGKLLVASPGVSAPFNQSVVFIANQNLFGAFGFIVNRPFAWKSGKSNTPTYYGGPVETCPAVVIGKNSDGSLQILPGKDPAAGSLAGKREFVGCSGWGMFQLNLEVASGAWGIVNYDPALVFDTPPDKIWDIAHNRALQDSVTKQKKFMEQYFHKK